MSDPATTTVKAKKEKKSKKAKAPTSATTEPVTNHAETAAESAAADNSPDSPMLDAAPSSPTRKRKRDDPVASEIEVDVSAPEPPSKKALRRLKKGKPVEPTATALSNAAIAAEEAGSEDATGAASGAQPSGTTTAKAGVEDKRSAHGIWIGNLSFAVNKASLKDFFLAAEGITAAAITRIHMPAPSNAASTRTQVKPQNKGFAYVDFDSREAMEAAMALSESVLGGRKVLIKDAKSFAGRPDKPKAEDGAAAAAPGQGNSASGAGSGRTKAALEGITGKPTKRVFVGNLGFDVTKADLAEHFARCGEVQDIHMATFEDSGKCKGYAWVTFAEVEASEAAVRGWVRIAEPGDDDEGEEEDGVEDEEEDGSGEGAKDEDDEGQQQQKSNTKSKKKAKKPRTRKWFVNRLLGRPLRCEFAEDATTRYRKRFGKDAASTNNANASVPDFEEMGDTGAATKANTGRKPRRSNQNQDIQPGAPTDPSRRRGRAGEEGQGQGQQKERKFNTGREDTRYRTGAIAEATGTKVTFD